MGRNFGFPNEERKMFYSEEDFKDGCSFNFWYGAGSGVVGTIAFFAVLAWVLNIV